jgi:cellulose synthase/poly-beta-1,6-N-acetylglucosamine synthase-like glycosyltransferase
MSRKGFFQAKKKKTRKKILVGAIVLLLLLGTLACLITFKFLTIASLAIISGIILMVVAQSLIIFFVLYQVIIGTWGIIKSLQPMEEKRNYEDAKHRFAILVCAHNEESVIQQIVRNLKGLNYPSSKYDVYVICDNCTDNTASIVRAEGAIAMERFNDNQRGKGFALEWMFDQLWNMEKNGTTYNAILVLDADNLISSNFLNVADRKLQDGYEAVQGYLDSKNPSDTWITKSYAFAYWSTNRVYQLARYRIGLSAQLGGTGMIFTTRVIKEMGWGATSLTEDLEFTMRYVLNTNRVVGWAHEAKLYDEKPLGFKASFRQRIRWMSGHINCMYRYSGKLLTKAILKGSLKHLDLFVYLVQPTRIMLTGGGLFFLLASWFHFLPSYISPYVVTHWSWTVLLAFYILQSLFGVVLESKTRYLWWFIPSYFFGLSWIPVTLIGWIQRKNTSWSHTKHNRVASDDEVKDLTA